MSLNDRIIRVSGDGSLVRWETAAWDSIRSDSHQIAVRVLADFWVQGSPARVIGDGCAVFGSGASRALDIVGCVEAMRLYVCRLLDVVLPPVERWIVSRVDVTGNLRLGDLAEVRAALAVLRSCEGGRYRVSQQAGDTVYWSHRSKLRSGKAYAKGPHLVHLGRQKSAIGGREYDARELAAAASLLRLELKLGREFWSRVNWLTCTPDALRAQWVNYFFRMIGDSAVTSDSDIRRRVIAAARPSSTPASVAPTGFISCALRRTSAARH